MFQDAVGWTDSHLHSLTIGEHLYGSHIDDQPEENLGETAHPPIYLARQVQELRGVFISRRESDRTG
jgi:hypothetical protein